MMTTTPLIFVSCNDNEDDDEDDEDDDDNNDNGGDEGPHLKLKYHNFLSRGTDARTSPDKEANDVLFSRGYEPLTREHSRGTSLYFARPGEGQVKLINLSALKNAYIRAQKYATYKEYTVTYKILLSIERLRLCRLHK